MTGNPEFYCLCSPLFGDSDEIQPLYGVADWYETYRDADTVDEVDYEQVTCPLGPKHMRAGKRIGNLNLELPTPHLSDFVWTVMSECVITDRVFQLFRSAGFTGFQVRDATIAKVKRLRKGSQVVLPRVWELLVTGAGGDAHPDSGIRRLYVCSGCGLQRYSSFRNGIVVESSHWGGSDFFTVNGYPRFILITERVKDTIIRNKLTNCAIFRSQDLRWKSLTRPEDHPEDFMPTRLPR